MIRILVFSLLGLGALATTPIVYALIAGLYSLRWFALEWLVLAAAIDLVFSVSGLPLYFVATALALIVIEWLRSIFSLY